MRHCGVSSVRVFVKTLTERRYCELKEAPEAKTLCLLSVPGALGASDLLAFAAACQQDIAHVRVLRDGSPDHYMALLTFRSNEAAREFHSAFDGVPYSSLEPAALCRAAWVARVACGRTGAPPPAHTELPTCPCVSCAHAFHADCLVRWRDASCPCAAARRHPSRADRRAADSARWRGLRPVSRQWLPRVSDCLVRWRDASCPVCRCAQTPEPRGQARCGQCALEGAPAEEGDESSRDHSGLAEGQDAEGGSLWICLICGNVGCGRYANGHAAKHFLASNHTFALQLGSNRVWDYAGMLPALTRSNRVWDYAGMLPALTRSNRVWDYRGMLPALTRSNRVWDYAGMLPALTRSNRVWDYAGMLPALTRSNRVWDYAGMLPALTRSNRVWDYAGMLPALTRSNGVWDYAGDNFVHRLVQNKADGKLVAAEGAGGEACGGDKLDSAQLEFTHILTQQLDTQRQYYDARILEVTGSPHSRSCHARTARGPLGDSSLLVLASREPRAVGAALLLLPAELVGCRGRGVANEL
ncbi:hypothetical protein MSG28_005994 [Choristoneura fumiferana]|uniref:Uncharacterized protein n=1 Tax=Choristoneura fumiferana TaxID=7141 RepID=A0ACC0L1X3_CHOFU|nr:hypothetical protein MSG28_005994 [Choristoneura fumiferana]